MQSIMQRRVSMERMAEIYRAIECRPLSTDREVSIEEAESFIPAERFGEFLERNRQTVQVYELGV